MPYELSWEPLGVVQRYSGVVSDEDLFAVTDQVNASSLFPDMKYQIVDFSVIENLDVSSAAVRAVADSDRKAAETNPDVKVAIITSAPFMRGMSNMYRLSHEGMGGSWTTEIFERQEDARAWAVPSSDQDGRRPTSHGGPI